jgi:anti-anti-sigma factor
MTSISGIPYIRRMVDFQLLLTEPGERTLVMKLSGELDLGTADPLRDATKAAVASGDYDTIVFDLTHLTFIDSSGLHLLTKVHRSMTAAGGGTRVICPSPHLMKVFELTGLTDYFALAA